MAVKTAEKPEATVKNTEQSVMRNNTAESASNEDLMAMQMGADADSQYVTFRLDREEYGVKILSVKEIISVQPAEVTHIPRTADFMRGVINLRGEVILLVDLRIRFGMEAREMVRNTTVIVLLINDGTVERKMGIVVDNVTDVMSLTEANLQELDGVTTSVDTAFISKVGKVGTRMIIVLDEQKLFSNAELANMTATVKK